MIEPGICAACGETYFDGCDLTHTHDVYCWLGFDDIRKLACDCWAHKNCQKSGETCRTHAEEYR